MVPGDGMSIGFARLIPRSARDCLRHPVCGALGAPGHRTCGSIPPRQVLTKKHPENGCFLWCLGTESNRRHRDFQSLALPTELPRQNRRRDALYTKTDQMSSIFLKNVKKEEATARTMYFSAKSRPRCHRLFAAAIHLEYQIRVAAAAAVRLRSAIEPTYLAAESVLKPLAEF